MSYAIYTMVKTIETEMEDMNGDLGNAPVFDLERRCFNMIVDKKQFNRKLPYFDLKENWALLKSQEFEAVLENIKQWLIKADDRYDGENWTENYLNPEEAEKLARQKRKEAKAKRAEQRILNRG